MPLPRYAPQVAIPLVSDDVIDVRSALIDPRSRSHGVETLSIALQDPFDPSMLTGSTRDPHWAGFELVSVAVGRVEQLTQKNVPLATHPVIALMTPLVPTSLFIYITVRNVTSNPLEFHGQLHGKYVRTEAPTVGRRDDWQGNARRFY